MIKKTMVAMLLMGTLVVTVSAKTPYITAGSEARADAASDCYNTCVACDQGCPNMGCTFKCRDDKDVCCVGHGLKPGGPTGCICGS
jgi:hypothetical protein